LNTSNHIAPHVASLDTLVQLTPENGVKSPATECGCAKKSYQKRAKAKATTDAMVFRMVDLESPLQKAYWNTFHCTGVIIQEGGKASATYCKNRWCIVCNRIRAAQLIIGYKEPLSNLENPYFVTLTIRSVPGVDLSKTMDEMYSTFRQIKKNASKQGVDIKGIRKLECNYNWKTKKYNPHFHLIVEGLKESKYLLQKWRGKNPKTTTRKAQDLQPINSETETGAMLELFKYFTKTVTKEGFNPGSADTIYRAFKGRRVVQPMGIKMVDVSDEEISNISAQQIDFKEHQNSHWTWHRLVMDWVNGWGELLSEYEPTKEDIELFEAIKNPYKNKENRTITQDESKPPGKPKKEQYQELTPNEVNQLFQRQWVEN
jgi:hypothetical protein